MRHKDDNDLGTIFLEESLTTLIHNNGLNTGKNSAIKLFVIGMHDFHNSSDIFVLNPSFLPFCTKMAP